MFTALSAVKFAVSGIVGMGTAKVVSGIVKNNVSAENLVDKVTILSATWVLSGVVTTASKKYTNDMIDDVAKSITDVLGQLKAKAKLNRINRGESTFVDEGLDQTRFRKENDQWVPISDKEWNENHGIWEDDQPAAS